jgi:prephenate dehydrogenase
VNDGPLFNRLALIGVGLIGSSIARAARAQGAVRNIVATARSAATRRRIAELGLADQVVETNAAAVAGADLVIVCIPVGACAAVAKEIGPHLAPGAIVSDAGSVKASVLHDMATRRGRSRSGRAAGGVLASARGAGRNHDRGASRPGARHHQPSPALDRLHHRRHGR